MKTHTKTAMAFAVASAIALSDAAMAALELEEIVVTARKRSENLQEVPIAVSALTEGQIQRAGIQRQSDMIALLPNVTLVDTANVGDTQVSIRGIVSTRDAESTFAYVVDGVLSTNPNSFNEELLDVQQIEVLKGPQGALYGRNAVAGAILVTTREPGEEFEGQVKVGAGNVGQMNASFVASGALSDNTRGRIAASYREMDGHYKNVFTNDDAAVDYLEDTTVRGRLIWDADDNIQVDMRAAISEVKAGAINFNAVFAIPAFASNFASDTYFADVNDHDFTFAFDVPGINEQETMEFAIKTDIALDWADLTLIGSYNDLEEFLLSDGTAATFLGYEFTDACIADRVDVNSLTRPDLFGQPYQPFFVGPPGTDPTAQVYGPYTATSCDGYQYQERNQQDASFEARLASDASQAVRWIGGVYLADIKREVVVTYGADRNQGFDLSPYVAPGGPNPTDLAFNDRFNTRVYAAYGQLEFDLNETMELAFAARYDLEEREVSNRVPNVQSSGLNFNLAGQPINPGFAAFPNGIPDRDEDFEQFQPKVSWNWQAAEDVNVYASWGIGFRSGGFNNQGTADLLDYWFNSNGGPCVSLGTGSPDAFIQPGNCVNAGLGVTDEYEKEVSETFEVGFKSEFWDRRVRLNAAAFYTEIDDNQFFEFFAGPFGLQRVVTTIDQVEISGFEFDFNAFLTDYVTVFGGAGFLDSEIKENRNRPITVGNDAPQAPQETYNLGGEVMFPVADGIELFARIDYQYVGEMWFHTLQGEQTPTIWNWLVGPFGFNQDFSRARRDAYDTVNLRVGLDAEDWSITAWGRNIGDEQYLEEVIPAPEFGGSFVHPSARDAYGVEAVYRF